MAPDVPKAQGQKYLAGFFRGKLGDVGMAMTIADQLDSGKVNFNDQAGSGGPMCSVCRPEGMPLREIEGAALCTAALFGMQTAPAFAPGKFEQGPDHPNSICSYSGLNDDPDDPMEGGRVQSYGQIVAAGFNAFAPSAGEYCNGHLYPYPEVQPPPPA